MRYPTHDKYASNVQGTCMLVWDRWVYWHEKQEAVLAQRADGAAACRAREAQLDNLAGKCGAYLDLVTHLAGVLWTNHAVKAVRRGDDKRVVREALERHLGLRSAIRQLEARPPAPDHQEQTMTTWSATLLHYCEANVRDSHPDDQERPCSRWAVRQVDGHWYCEQHAKQADQGLNLIGWRFRRS